MTATEPTRPPLAVQPGGPPSDNAPQTNAPHTAAPQSTAPQFVAPQTPADLERRPWPIPELAPGDNGPLTEPLGRIPSQASGSQRHNLARPLWTFVDVFAGLGAVLLASLVIGAAVQFGSWDGGPARLLVSALPVWIGLLGTAVWACRRHGTGNLVRDLALHFKWVDLAIGLGAGLGLRLVIGIWTVTYTRISGQTPSGNLQPILGSGLGTGFWLVVNVLVIAVAGPLIEEIFFRGLGLRSALASLWRRADRPRYADPKRRVWYAAGATSLLFAGLHISEVSDLGSAIVLLPGLFVAGWVLARLTIWSGRLGPAVITHVVFNGVAVIALLALQ